MRESEALLKETPILHESADVKHIVLVHPTEDWIRSSLPEKLVLTMNGKEWTAEQRQHLQLLIDQAKRMRNAAVLASGALTPVASKLLATPLRKRSLRDSVDETLCLEKAILNRAMMQCDLFLPQPQASGTLAFLMKHHRIPPKYIDKIRDVGVPGGGIGFAKLLEDIVENRLLLPDDTPPPTVDVPADADHTTLATLLLMDASTSGVVSSVHPNERGASAAPSQELFFYSSKEQKQSAPPSLKKQILLDHITKAVESSKIEIEPGWLKRMTTSGRPLPAALFGTTNFARDMQLRVSAAEDVVAVIENRKRLACRLQQRDLLRPLTPVCTTSKLRTYSPISKDERNRCDAAWHDHPFYMFLDEAEVKRLADIERDKRASSTTALTVLHEGRSLSRYSSILHKLPEDSRSQYQFRLEDEALDWSSSGPAVRSEAEQRYLAIQLVKEQQHAVYHKIRNTNSAATTDTPPQNTSHHASPLKISSRLQELSAPRQAARQSPIAFIKEHQMELVERAAEQQRVVLDARKVTLPVFLNIRSFA